MLELLKMLSRDDRGVSSADRVFIACVLLIIVAIYLIWQRSSGDATGTTT